MPSRFLNPLRFSGDETHLPAKPVKAGPYPRLSCTHGDKSRPSRAQAPSCERPYPPYAPLRFLAVTADRCDPGFAFGKSHRLGNAQEYGRVFEKARRSRDSCFTILARARRRCHEPGRLGLAIAKKHGRKASARNRVKRLVRESFRHHQSQLRGLDVVVLNRPAAVQKSNRELLHSLERHWRRLCRA